MLTIRYHIYYHYYLLTPNENQLYLSVFKLITHQCISFSECKPDPGSGSFVLLCVDTRSHLLDNLVIHRGYPDTS